VGIVVAVIPLSNVPVHPICFDEDAVFRGAGRSADGRRHSAIAWDTEQWNDS
jgi:hypothetical protein